MNANKLRSRFEKPAAGVALIAALGTIGVSGCSAETPSRVVTAVCSGEQLATVHAGDTYSQLIQDTVRGDAARPNALGVQQLTEALEANQDKVGGAFTINSATSYDAQQVKPNAGDTVKLPQECTVTEYDGPR